MKDIDEKIRYTPSVLYVQTETVCTEVVVKRRNAVLN